MSTISIASSSSRIRTGPRIRAGFFGSALLAALDCFGDALDAAQAGVPGGADRRQLRDGAGELSLVDFVEAFAPGRRGVDQADPVEHAEMLRDRLARDRQALAECRRGAAAVGQQQVEHLAPDGVADGGPEFVVYGDAHGVDTKPATYVTRRGRK